MLNAVKRKLAGAAIQGVLRSLATSKDAQTTAIGVVAGVILAIHGLDFSALLAGDPHQVALVVSGIAVWGVGLLATKLNADGKTTLLGVIAGAARMYVGDMSGAVAVAVCGYLTNKAPDPPPGPQLVASKKLAAGLAICALLFIPAPARAQTAAGTVTFTPPNLLTVTAGSETCTIAKVAGPAVQIGQVCVLGVLRDAPPIKPLLEGWTEGIMHISPTGDSILVLLTLQPDGSIKWEASGAPAGIIPGHPGSANGSGVF